MSYKQIIPSFSVPLFYTVGSHELSIVCIVVCIWQSQFPNLCQPPSPLLVFICLFYMSVYLFLLCKWVYLYCFFLDSTYLHWYTIFVFDSISLYAWMCCLCICPLTSHPKCKKNVCEIMNIYTDETLSWSGAYTGYH